MPQDVIDRVHVLARRQNVARGLEFLDRNNDPINTLDGDDLDDDPDDPAYDPDEEPDDDLDEDELYDLPDDYIAGVMEHFNNDGAAALENANDENGEEIADFHGDGAATCDNDAEADGEDAEEANGEVADNDNEADGEDAEEANGEVTNNDNEADGEDAEEANGEVAEEDNEDIHDELTDRADIADADNEIADGTADLAREMDARYGPRTGAYNLRPRRPRDYGHLHTTMSGIMLAQHTMKKGLKLFGDEGTEAVLTELKQLHDRKVMVPEDPDELSKEDKEGALEYLMFLKQKRCGKIKGRGCADGRKVRLYTAKEEAISPSVSIEAVMLSCVLDANEGRDVATADIPGAFMQADMDEIIYMRLEGTMADLLIKLDPDTYQRHARKINGKTVLYVRLIKALYGTLRAALLFWRKLSSKLKEWGFEINPYDWCVANKVINGEQCTVLRHVDDLKILTKIPILFHRFWS
jgi:hypothetical protein